MNISVRAFEKLREERLRFFEEYDRLVPKDMYAFAQMTIEATSDEEYLRAMYKKMRIRTALIGVESFSEEGLKSAGKECKKHEDDAHGCTSPVEILLGRQFNRQTGSWWFRMIGAPLLQDPSSCVPAR